MEAEGDPDGQGLFSIHFCDMILIILGNPLFCSARKPYVEPMLRHDLGPMNVKCPSCGALHFAAERVSGSSKQNLHWIPAETLPHHTVRLLCTSDSTIPPVFLRLTRQKKCEKSSACH